MDLLDRMLGYDRWTTERVLLMCQGLSDAQLTRLAIIRRSALDTPQMRGSSNPVCHVHWQGRAVVAVIRWRGIKQDRPR